MDTDERISLERKSFTKSKNRLYSNEYNHLMKKK